MYNINRVCAPEERRRMIETAAYYRAEKRGFFDGDPVKDWLEAEKEIEISCQHPDDGPAGKQERAALRRMRAEFKKILAGSEDTIYTDSIRQAFNRSGRELKELGKLVPETVDRAGKRLKQEADAAVEKMGPRWNAFSEKSRSVFEVWQDKMGQFANQAPTTAKSWMSRYRDKSGKGKNEDQNGL